MKPHSLSILLLVALTVLSSHGAEKPNVVYILADDLGYGDVSCLNKNSKIKTPNMDRLARQGMIFTDAHSGSAVCTPTRYGILTGRYAWRTHLRSGVLWGWSPPLIASGRPTVASLLKGAGYATACLGKWHLGMDWPFVKPGDAAAWKMKAAGAPDVDYSKPIRNGPTTVGFDYYFGISASLDMPPYCWIENDRTVGLPSATKVLWKNRTGAAHPDFSAVDVLPGLTKKACAYIDQRAKEAAPFFIYMPLNSPHTPIATSPDFAGKSGLGDYGDFVLQTDWAVGEVMAALERNGLSHKTLIILTSDNGCSPEANFSALAGQGHNPNYVFRGHKADVFEGGHRVPFIARWPENIKPGSHCDDPICLTDLTATCAEIVGFKLPESAAEDSVSILPNLLGVAHGPVREATVHQSMNGSLAIRQGKWKLAMCADSGGWSSPKPGTAESRKLPSIQLFDLEKDVGETTNLASAQTDVVARLQKLLQKYIDEGRSTSGAAQSNDIVVKLVQPKNP